MILTHRSEALLWGGLAGLIAFAAEPAPARADIMAVCSSEIGSYCADVPEGRGRIAACLVGNESRLSAACKPEVQALAQRTTRNVLMPQSVRNLLAPGFQAPLPASCEADASRYCSGIAPGDGRVFACLYAREGKVSQTCSAAAEEAISQAN